MQYTPLQVVLDTAVAVVAVAAVLLLLQVITLQWWQLH
jgi:hypothetical protein